MALQVWLPLINNVENQGVSNIPIINNGVTFVDNGKIGKCASFNNNYFSLQNLSNFNTISVSFWMKPANTNQTGCLLNYRTGIGLDIAVFLIQGKVRFDAGGQTIFNYTYTTDWQHITVTYDGNVKSLYINGILNQSVTVNKVISCSATKGTVGASSVNTTSGSDNNYIGLLNDYRIYNHCLSPKEVKEISRGMVLHYKMCQPERSENLLSNWCNITKWTTEGVSQVSVEPDSKFNKVLTFTPSSGTMRIYYSTSNVWTTNGATFTVSGYVKSSSASTMRFSRSLGDYGAGVATTTSWKKFSTVITLTGTSTAGTLSIQGSSGIKYYLANLKLERGTNPDPQWSPAPQDNPNWGTIEYDGSGFKNHGTVSGNVTLSADSPRYTGSYSLADGKYITAPGLTYINSGSISFWAKINTLASNGWLPFTGPTNSHYIMASTGGTGSFYHNAAGNGTKTIYEDGKVITAPSSIGVWHHYVITNVDLTTWTKFMINNYDYNWNANMQMSDIRVYSTILDATDVAELYKLGK